MCCANRKRDPEWHQKNRFAPGAANVSHITRGSIGEELGAIICDAVGAALGQGAVILPGMSLGAFEGLGTLEAEL